MQNLVSPHASFCTIVKRPVSAPADFCEEGRRLWLATQRALRRQGTWQDSDAVTLERYVRAVVLARSARETADANPFVPGSRGQLVAHPGLKVAREAAQDASRYAAELLLTPQARVRHNIAPEPRDSLEAALA
jgi:P27 family predicted phage terminase small subunit